MQSGIWVLVYCLNLQATTEVILSSEASVPTYQTARCPNPEDQKVNVVCSAEISGVSVLTVTCGEQLSGHESHRMETQLLHSENVLSMK